MKKIMLLGSGELGRELTISLKRLGCMVIACDRYENAPAMQVADRSMVFDMLNEAQLRAHIKSVDPDLVVPEIEAINTQVLLDVESQRTVVPSARAVDLTMNRDRIRDRAAEIGLPTAKYGYAENVDEMLERLKYDVLYIENMSLLIDLKIMIHTILIILEGRGK